MQVSILCINFLNSSKDNNLIKICFEGDKFLDDNLGGIFCIFQKICQQIMDFIEENFIKHKKLWKEVIQKGITEMKYLRKL